jgi:hypothetical protein
MVPSDPADLFCELYDALDDARVRAGEADEWADAASEQDIAQLVEEQALMHGRFDTERVEQELEQADDIDGRRWAYLLGLDRAFAAVHPALDSAERGALTDLAVRYRTQGRLNSTDEIGGLLPRVAVPQRLLAMDDPPVESKADLFSNVTRVAPDLWSRVRPVRIPREADLLSDVTAALEIGCPPVASAPDVTFSTRSNTRRQYYIVDVTEPAEMQARIRPILQALDQSGASVALLPELTLTADLVASWEQTLRSTPPPQGSHLRILAIGSGAVVPRNERGLAPNRAVVLARTGDPLWKQDKRHGFTLNPGQIASWGLERVLGDQALAEPIIPDTHITIAESTVGRIVSLVCEDLGRLMEDGPVLRALGPSLAISPVLSPPTLPWYWEHQDARKLVAEVGTQTVVANSLIVEESMRQAGTLDDRELGTALAQAASGHFDSGHCPDPTGVMLFRFTADQVVRAERITPEA